MASGNDNATRPLPSFVCAQCSLKITLSQSESEHVPVSLTSLSSASASASASFSPPEEENQSTLPDNIGSTLESLQVRPHESDGPRTRDAISLESAAAAAAAAAESLLVSSQENTQSNQSRGARGGGGAINRASGSGDDSAGASTTTATTQPLSLMDESFVMLHDREAANVADEMRIGGFPITANNQSRTSPNQINTMSLDAHVKALSRMFDVANETLDTGEVKHPLCTECAALVLEELTRQAEDAEEEAAAYEAAIARLEAERGDVTTSSGREDDGDDDAEEKEEQDDDDDDKDASSSERCAALRAELAAVEAELQSLRGAEASVALLEEAHHHAMNAHHLELHDHLEERDYVLRQLDVANAQLQVLRCANVLEDAFHIWHDGPFGTISGFRLGRMPGIPVEWDEINAAWGQACLLLQSLANHCRVTFTQHRLLPMGSTPRVADRKGVYELYGPVNVFWSARYDRAMVGFLACLDELGSFARSKDLARGVPSTDAFALPHRIEGDRIDGKTIKLSLNRNELWTAALKLMLTDLKILTGWCSGS